MSGARNAPPTTRQVEEQALRDGIAELMRQCTEAQIAGLHRIHNSAPWKGLDNCPPAQLSATYELLRRTVMKNAKDAGGAP